MLNFSLEKLNSVLCVGAHADDIEVGCGGTILRLVREHPRLSVFWAVFSAGGRRAGEAKASARAFLKGAGKQRVVVKGYRDGFFPFQGAAVKEYFEELKRLFQPDLVFTHYRDDRHQDHRVLSDLAWNTFRNHVILSMRSRSMMGIWGTRTSMFLWRKECVGRRSSILGLFSRPKATSTGFRLIRFWH